MARRDINIGVEGNDGTGDSIRSSFNKVNENFVELYAVFGLGGRINFTSLNDTPDRLTPTAIPIVNSAGTALMLTEVDSSDAGAVQVFITDGVGDDPGKIKFISTFQKVSDDVLPRLGGPLHATGNIIAGAQVSEEKLAEFNATHGTILGMDSVVLTQGYADQRYFSSQVPISIEREPATVNQYSWNIFDYVSDPTSDLISALEIISHINEDGNNSVTGHGLTNAYNGTAVRMSFQEYVPTPFANYADETYYIRILDETHIWLYKEDWKQYATTDNEADARLYKLDLSLVPEIGATDVHTMTLNSYDPNLTGNYLTTDIVPRKDLVYRHGDTMTGTLYMSDHPGTLQGVGTPNGKEDLSVATKLYVDKGAAWKSPETIFVSTEGDDMMIGVPEGQEGSSISTAYRTINKAAERAEELINASTYVPNAHRQSLTYTATGTTSESYVLDWYVREGVEDKGFNGNVRELLLLNRDFIISETAQYNANSYPNYTLSKEDIGIFLDSIIMDMTLGSTANFLTLSSVKTWFSNIEKRREISFNKTEILDIISYAQDLSKQVLLNDFVFEGKLEKIIHGETTVFYLELPNLSYTEGQKVRFRGVPSSTGFDFMNNSTFYIKPEDTYLRSFELYYDKALLTPVDTLSVGADYQFTTDAFSGIILQDNFLQIIDETVPTTDLPSRITDVEEKWEIIKTVMTDGLAAGPDKISYGMPYQIFMKNASTGKLDQTTIGQIEAQAGKILIGKYSGARGEVLRFINDNAANTTVDPKDPAVTETLPTTFEMHLLTPVHFIPGEPIEYANKVKAKSILIKIENGKYYEDFPIKLSENVSLIGDDSRQTIVQPKTFTESSRARTSQSKWAQEYFYRDLMFDDMAISSTGVQDYYNQDNNLQGSFGYHYLTMPDQPLNLGADIVVATYPNGAMILESNARFIATETDAIFAANNSSVTYDNTMLIDEISRFVNATAKDFKAGGIENIIEAQSWFYNNPNLTFSVLGHNYTLEAVNTAQSLCESLLQGTSITPVNTIITPTILQDENGVFILGEADTYWLVQSFNDKLVYCFDPSFNPAKPNNELDAFMLGDGSSIREITVQGIGGFMAVFDPQGQIVTRTAHIENCHTVTASIDSKRFAGTGYFDGYAGNIPLIITNVLTEDDDLAPNQLDPATNLAGSLTLEVTSPAGQGLFVKPLVLPAPFFVEGRRYQVNAVEDYDKTNGTATIYLDDTSNEGYGYTPNQFSDWVAGEQRLVYLQMGGERTVQIDSVHMENDLAYGIVTTNSSIARVNNSKTFYCQAGLYATNGSRLWTQGCINNFGNFGIVAEGADPNEIPDQVQLKYDMTMPIFANTTSVYHNKEGHNSIVVRGLPRYPHPDSIISIDHEGALNSMGVPTYRLNYAISFVHLESLGATVEENLYRLTLNTDDSTNIDFYNTLQTDIPDGALIEYTDNKQFTFYDIRSQSALNPRPSTAVNFDESDTATYNTSSFDFTDPFDDPINYDEARITFDLPFSHVELGIYHAHIADGYGSSLSDERLAVIRLDDTGDFPDSQRVIGKVFSWYGRKFKITEYSSVFSILTDSTDPFPQDTVMTISSAGTAMSVKEVTSATKFLYNVTGNWLAGYDINGTQASIADIEETEWAIIKFEMVPNSDIRNDTDNGIRKAFDVETTRVLATLEANATAEITQSISLAQAMGHMFNEIGRGSKNDSNFPQTLYGASNNPLADFYTTQDDATSAQAYERRKGRCFWVGSDQYGFFRVGHYFDIDQATGQISFTGNTGIANATSLGFTKGVVIDEFSVDDSFIDLSGTAVPTEKATAGYISRVLGFNFATQLVRTTGILGPGFLPLSGSNANAVMTGEINMGDNKITDLADPENLPDAVNKRYVDKNITTHDSIIKARDYAYASQTQTLASNQILVSTGAKIVYTELPATGTFTSGMELRDAADPAASTIKGTIIHANQIVDPILGDTIKIVYATTLDADSSFIPSATTLDEDEFTFTNPHELQDQDIVIYDSNGNDPINNLIDGDPYYVKAISGTAIELYYDSTFYAPVGNLNYLNTIDSAEDTSISGNVITFKKKHKLVDGDDVVYTNGGNPNINNMTDSQSFSARVLDEFKIALYTDSTFATSAGPFDFVNTVTPDETSVDNNEITFPSNHLLQSGDKIIYTNEGNPSINNLQNNGVYYAGVIDPFTIRLYTTPSLAYQIDDLVYVNSIDGSPISVSGNVITFPKPHNLQAGNKVIYSNNGNADITGLTDGTAYYVVPTSLTAVRLFTDVATTNQLGTLTHSLGTHTFTTPATANTTGSHTFTTPATAHTTGTHTFTTQSYAHTSGTHYFRHNAESPGGTFDSSILTTLYAGTFSSGAAEVEAEFKTPIDPSYPIGGAHEEVSNASPNSDNHIELTTIRETDKTNLRLRYKPRSIVNSHVGTSAAIQQSKLSMERAGTLPASDTAPLQSQTGLAVFQDDIFTSNSGFIGLNDAVDDKTGVQLKNVQHIRQGYVLGRTGLQSGQIGSVIEVDNRTIAAWNHAIERQHFPTRYTSGVDVLVRTGGYGTDPNYDTFDNIQLTVAPTADTVVHRDADGSIFVHDLDATGFLDVDENSHLHGSLTVDGTTLLDNDVDVTGLTNFNNVTDSTTFTNGAIVVDGGVGIAKNLNVDGLVYYSNTTDSTSISTGTLVVDGGVGIALNLNVGGDTTIDGLVNFNDTTDSSNYTDGSIIIDGGVGIAKNTNIGGHVDILGELVVGDKVLFYNNTPSTSCTTGALVVTGGVGITGDIYSCGTINQSGVTILDNDLDVSGMVTFTNITDSTAFTNGALLISGGVGIAKNVNIGGSLTVGGDTTITGNITVGGNNNLGNANTDTVTFDAEVTSDFVPDPDDTYDLGSMTQEWRNLWIDGIANVDDLVVDENVIIYGTTSQHGAITAQDTLTIFGDVDFKSNLNVDGNFDAGGNGTIGGTFDIGSDTTIGGFIDVGTTATIAGATTIGGHTQINNTLTATGNTQIGGTLDVTGASTITSLYTSGNTTVAGTLTVTGPLTDITNLTASGDANITGDTQIGGDTTIAGDVVVAGETTLNGDVNIGNANTDTVTVTGSVDSNIVPSQNGVYSLGESSMRWKEGWFDNLSFTGAILDTIDISDYAVIGTDLTVHGITTLNGNVILGDSAADSITFPGTVQSNIIPSPTGTQDLGSATQEWNDLFIDGTAKIDTLVVDENTNIAGALDTVGNVSFHDTLTVDGNTNIKSNLDVDTNLNVDGDTTLNSTLDVDGSVNFHSGLVVDVNLYVGGITTLVGDTNIQSNLDVDANLNVDGNSVLVGDVDVTGATELFSTLDVTDDTTLQSNLTVVQNTVLSGTLQVNSPTTLNDTLLAQDPVTLNDTLDVYGVTTLHNTTESIDAGTGALVIDGGVGIDKRLNVDGATLLNNILDVTNQANFNDTINTTSPTTGTVVVDGGVGIGMDLNIGGNVDVAGIINFNNTTNSTDPTTGTLVVDGGVGIAQDVHIGGDIYVDGVIAYENTTDSSSPFTGTITVAGGVGIAQRLNVGGDTDIDGITNCDNTTESTSTATGSLVVDGGVGIDKRLNVGGATLLESTLDVTGLASFNNTTDSTSTTTGSVVVAGGVGIQRKLVVGDDVHFLSDLKIDGGDLTTNLTAFNVLNEPTTITAFLAGTDIDIGAATGITSINHNLDVDLDVNIDGGNLTTNLTEFALLNTNATTIDAFETAQTINIGNNTEVGGAFTGTTHIQQNLDVDGELNVDRDVYLNKDITLGTDDSNSIWINGRFESSLLPASHLSTNIGSNSQTWLEVYGRDLYVTNIFDQLQNPVFTVSSGDISIDNNIHVPNNLYGHWFYEAGTTTQVMRLLSGNVYVSNDLGVTGDITGSVITATTNFSGIYADLAENYLGDAEYEPGTVLVFGGAEELTTTSTKGDRRIAGVVSENPAVLMNKDLEGKHVTTLALQGRVMVKVLGKVEKGDMLVTSAQPGYAIVDNDPRVGTVLGKAVSEKTDSLKGFVEVVVGRV